MPQVGGTYRPNPQQAEAAEVGRKAGETPAVLRPTVLLVRHGHTKLNSEKGERLRGWLDIPLTLEGRADAERAGERLKSQNVGHLVSSDLRRARETAHIIGEKVGKEPAVNKALRPWNVGEMAGKRIEDIRDELQHYQNNPGDAPPGGESFRSFYERWEKELLELLKKAEAEPGKTVVALTHVRNLLTAPHILAGDEPRGVRVVETPHPSPGRITPVVKKNGKWRIDKSEWSGARA